MLHSPDLLGERIVNSTADPGDGLCDAQECTLREAIAAANTFDTLYFALPDHSTITLHGEALEIDQSLAIEGSSAPGLTIAGNQQRRIFNILPGAVVKINRLMLTEGKADVGGAILNQGTLVLRNSTIYNNQARLGGGLYTDQEAQSELYSCTFSHNQAERGGAIFAQGALSLAFSTVTQNQASDPSPEPSGGGLFADAESLVELASTLIAQNQGGDCGEKEGRGSLRSLGANLDGDGSCHLTQASDQRNRDPQLAPLADHGGSMLTHAPLPDSPVVDGGTIHCLHSYSDQRGLVRPQGLRCDIGAVERASGHLLLLSSASSGTVFSRLSQVDGRDKPGHRVRFSDEDILSFNPDTGEWRLYFDGSDVGLSATDIDALALDDSAILMSFQLPVKLEGVGRVEPSDIVRFLPASLGPTTEGRWQWFLDGSDVGLDAKGEDIDALALTADHELLVSTRARFRVVGMDGEDEDLILLKDATFGQTSTGHWLRYLDGSAVALAAESEDLHDIALNPSHQLTLSTAGDFSVPWVSGDSSDLLLCTPLFHDEPYDCAFRPLFDGDRWRGFGGERIDGVEVVVEM